MRMKTAVCDPDAFFPLRELVLGPVASLDQLVEVERFIRTAVLHDETTMELTPVLGVVEAVPAEAVGISSTASGSKTNLVTPFAAGYSLAGFDCIIRPNTPHMLGCMGDVLVEFAPVVQRNFEGKEQQGVDISNTELTDGDADFIQLAKEYAKDAQGTIANLIHLSRVFTVVAEGGSALMGSEFGRRATNIAEEYPNTLFRQLDEDWQHYAKAVMADGFDFLLPPLLGIVLTRSARRDAIPVVIRDLRDEWAGARQKVWNLLDTLRICRTLDEALQIRRELADASRLFSPERKELDTSRLI